MLTIVHNYMLYFWTISQVHLAVIVAMEIRKPARIRDMIMDL